MLGHPYAFEAPSWGTALSAFFPTAARSQPFEACPPAPPRSGPSFRTGTDASAFDDDTPVEWSEEDVVFLHWRLLQEVNQLSDPATPLEDKFDTLRWVFTEQDKDRQPFSFVNCLRVVGCSPLSPIAYCGLVDAQDIRDHIRNKLKLWLSESLARYPQWVRDAIANNPQWVETRLAKNPQWINEQIKQMSEQGDLFT